MFQTKRLTFRKWRVEDAESFYLLNSHPIVMEFFPSVLTRLESDSFFHAIVERMEKDGFGFWAVEEQETQRFIGFIGLNSSRSGLDIEPCVEIGWRLLPQFWGKGYATEGAQAALDYGFETLNIDRIYSFTATLNRRSERLMKRLGMTQSDNFYHPSLSSSHPLCEHVLYFMDKPHREPNA